MIVFLLAACSSSSSDGPLAPKGEITADAVLQRHLDESNQCALMVADNYYLEWESVTTDKKSASKLEKIVQLGRQGRTFARLHQQLRPKVRFTGFGLDPAGSWWSAGDLGVRVGLPEEVVKPLSVHQDPTPICAFQARWPERVYVGEEDWNGQRTHHVRGVWADGVVTELWFDTGTGLLAGTRTEAGTTTNTLVFKKYGDRAGMKWPEEVFSTRIDGDLHLYVAQKLKELRVNDPAFRDIGFDEVAVMVTQQVKALESMAPKQGG